ncbi:AMP-binding enzyme family protein (macronuclear) [Tetrahymena thermophila SB210]|uniref:AMP-binding enzyme family protein n=1 Tax=Tetrahymena thermophila (strain SB210) TaxID=312017 RepID=Q23LP8_TETTS|nr:AMP-binding enzyme family protein [Tetrahymena thermophila SB210]EAR97462.2 AMP-binding enzyme family protein [Tetrahymena thermophila SB210]|eukprot:XP_001017707.2 AMP-binding enzyme family protein [Tetrahymena thermophila SB210]
MNIFKLDLFSSEFYFSLGGQQYRKGTVQGIFLSIISAATIISYFSYLLNQLINNQIDPKFRSQSFLVNHRIEVSMNQDLMGFLFNYNQTFTMDQLEQKQNKTYLVYYAQFFTGDGGSQRLYNLDVVQCTNPNLKKYRCIDFSKISNETLVLDNSKNIFSQIQINIYGCHDLDSIKTTIPNNCASQQEIDDAINGAYGFVQLKLQVQQYNTTSKQMQTDYRRISTFLLSNQFIMTNIHAQKQETEVSSGLLFQTKETQSSPIQYDSQNQSYDRQQSLDSGLGPYNQISIQMDEIVQQFQIQFPTITEILALVNSVAAIVMIARFLGKFCSQKLITQDLFMLILSNLFQEKNEQILKHNKFIDQTNDVCFYQQNNNLENQDEILETQEKQNANNIFVPSFQTKFRDFVETSQMINSNSDVQYTVRKSETEEDQKESKENQITNALYAKPSNRRINQQNNLQNKHQFRLYKKSEILEKDNESPRQIFDQEKSTIYKNETLKQSQFYKSDFIIDSQSNDIVQKSVANKGFNSNVIAQKLKAINSSTLNKTIQNFIFKFKIFRRKQFEISKGIDSRSIKGIGQETMKHLDIFNLYKDIIFLKKAILMLLRRDQLAAIQLVGLTDDYLNIDLRDKSSKNDFDKNKKLSHFESQFLILQSEELQAEYIEIFLNKFKNDQDLNDVDARIISSIFKKK